MKKIGLILTTILCLCCVVLDVWYLVVFVFGTDKEVSNTFEVGMLETVDGSEKKAFIELNYYSNENNNGLELFEVKLNFFMDENKTDIVSIGMQYVANTKDDEIKWSVNGRVPYFECVKEGWEGITYHDYWDVYYSTFLTGNNSYYEYQSSDDYETVIGNEINPINKDSRFKVTMGDEVYQMALKFNSPDRDFLFYSKTEGNFLVQSTENRYQYVDNHLLAYNLYRSVKEANYGDGEYSVAQFADYFDYYEPNGNEGGYNKVSDINTEKVKSSFQNFYVIKINKYKDGATVADDSIFNTIKGNSLFTLNGDFVAEDYYYGRSVVAVNYDDFNVVKTEDGGFILSLKDSFIKAHKPYANKIVLDVDVDFTSELTFNGFNTKSFKDFRVYECSVNNQDYVMGVSVC